METNLLSIDTQLYLIAGGLTLLLLFAAWQAFKLRGIYRSNSSWVGAFTFFLLASRQAFTLYRLKSNIAAARARGIMIDHLTTEQWLVAVVWAYAVAIGFVVWMHWQRQDLKRLGV